MKALPEETAPVHCLWETIYKGIYHVAVNAQESCTMPGVGTLGTPVLCRCLRKACGLRQVLHVALSEARCPS